MVRLVKDDDNIIGICGMSGRFPSSNSVEEFKYNLYNGINMVTRETNNLPLDSFILPKYVGRVKSPEKFDNEFFKIPNNEVNYVDHQLRLLLEVSYEAIVDSGTDPKELNGQNVGVFIGSCFHETEFALGEEAHKLPAHKNIYATQLSSFYGFKGPTSAYDTACASGFCALNEAYYSMKYGICDKAIVAAYNVSRIIAVTLQFQDLKMISNDGISKCCDKDADGFSRADAVVALFLQKSHDCKRIYASVVHCKSNCDGFKEEGINFPSYYLQKRLMEEVYSECYVNTKDLPYIEAHVTGTQAGDPVELRAIEDVFFRENRGPLHVGCLKSNMGHSEGSSGLCSAVKVLLIFQTQLIPKNLNYNQPNPNIPGLLNNRLKPVTEIIPHKSDIIPINCFGFGGVNVHAILKTHQKRLNETSYKIAEEFPRLINLCARNEEGIIFIIDKMKNSPNYLTSDFLEILHDPMNTLDMGYRGFVLIEKNFNDFKFTVKMNKFEILKDISLMFPGLQSNPEIDSQLMNINSFKQTIYRIKNYLKRFNTKLDLSSKKENISLTQFIIMNLVKQIGLVNIFKDIINCQITSYISSSFGELIAAYFDGNISEEGIINCGYLIAQNFSNFKIAAILTSDHEIYKKIKNSFNLTIKLEPYSYLVFGNLNSLKSLQNYCSQESINYSLLSNEYDSSNLAKIRSIFNKINGTRQTILLKNSLTYCQSFQDIANYVTNKIGHETEISLPNDSIVFCFGHQPNLEIDPSIALISTNGSVNDLLLSIGKLYLNGYNPEIRKLYPKVSYPVAVDTPDLGSLIQWDHSKNFMVYQFPDYFNFWGSSHNYNSRCNLNASEDWFFSDHKIDGRIVYPATGYLMLAWCAMLQHRPKFTIQNSVKFVNVSFNRATFLSEDDTRFIVIFNSSTGRFIIVESNSEVANGYIFLSDDKDEEWLEYEDVSWENGLKLSDIYKEFRVRGYDYGPAFQNLVETNQDGTKGKICWKEITSQLVESSVVERSLKGHYTFLRTWITFTDCALQMLLINNHLAKDLFVPTRIDSLVCSSRKIIKALKESKIRQSHEQKNSGSHLNVEYDPILKTIKAPGIIIREVKVSNTSRKPNIPQCEIFKFIPCYDNFVANESLKLEIQQYFDLCLELVNEGDSKNLPIQNFDLTNEKYAFLKLLKEQKGTELENNLSNDILFGNGNNLIKLDIFLRPLLENGLANEIFNGSMSMNFNIGEINNTESSLIANIIDIIDFVIVGTSNINAYLAHCHRNICETRAAVNKLSWDGSTIKPAEMLNLDLLLYRIGERPNFDLDEIFTSLLKAIKENGSLLVISKEYGFTKDFYKMLTKICSEEQLNSMNNFVKMDELIEVAKRHDLVLINKRVIDSNFLPIYGLLFKRKYKPDESTKIIKIDENTFDWIEEIKQEIKKDPSRLWLISNSTDSGLYGLVKSLSLEIGGGCVRCICVRNSFLDNFDQLNFNEEPYREIFEKDFKFNVFDKDLGWGTYNHIRINDYTDTDIGAKTFSNKVFVKPRTIGDLSSLEWVEDNNQESGQVIDVFYAGLNFRDIMIASGRLSLLDNLSKSKIMEALSGTSIGLEFSGLDMNGNRVMGMTCSKALATQLITDDDNFLWPVPPHWTLEEAATIPVVYSTVYYALILRGKLRAGETVLIHAGSGGVGFAAITICLSMNCKVFTTVGTQAKRDFIKHHFPLNDEQIFNSRDIIFEENVLKQTHGRGVDVVLNSLAEEKLQAGVRCLADGGRFVEIGKFDFFVNNQLDISNLDGNKSFEAVLLDALYKDVNDHNPKIEAERRRISELLVDGVRRGIVKPLPTTVFEYDKIESAFRFMASGKHTGKVVIKIKDESNYEKIVPKPILARKSIFFDKKKYFIIIGGFGGLGLEIAQWIVFKGGRKIILHSRSGPKNGFHHYCIKRMKEFGSDIIISQEDLIDYNNCSKFIDKIQEKAPIGGIFNCSLVLSDGLFENQTQETFKAVCDPKVTISKNIDILTTLKCPHLDYFVLMSSVACGRGNPGQTNYSYANSIMENICERRRSNNLPGLAIQWGIIGDVGYVMEQMKEGISIKGTSAQRIPSILKTLETFLNYRFSTISSLVRSDNQLYQSIDQTDLLKIVSHILGIKDIHAVDPNLTLSELGMDSLMAIEIRQALDRDYGLTMTPKEIRGLKVHNLIELSQKIKDKQSVFKLKNELLNLHHKYDIYIPEKCIIYLNDIKNGKPIIFFPPIDGNYSQLSQIAQKLNRPAIGLNWTVDLTNKTFQEISEIFAEKLIELDQDDKDAIAFSFGGLVCRYTALTLQKRNKSLFKNIVMLDSDVNQLKYAVKEMYKEYKSLKLSLRINLLIDLMMNTLRNIDKDNVKSELIKLNNDEERKEKAKMIMKENDVKNIDNVIIAWEMLIHKLELIDHYELDFSQYLGKQIHIIASQELFMENSEKKSSQCFEFQGNHYNFITKNIEKIAEQVNVFLNNS